MSEPLAYLITYSTYGTWLHGKAKGSVDPEHNDYGAPFLPPDAELEARMGQSLSPTIWINNDVLSH